MEVDTINLGSEEREEGEIVEDEFEDVSDVSMSPNSPLYFGKSVTPPELMRAVSLSSVSDSDYKLRPGRNGKRCAVFHPESTNIRNHSTETLDSIKRKRKSSDSISKNTRRYHTRHRRRSVGSSTDSEDEKVDRKYLRQLKEAVRRETSQEVSHKNLKSRLKVMISKVSPHSSDDDQEIAKLRDFALLSTFKNSAVTLMDDKPSIIETDMQVMVNVDVIQGQVVDVPTQHNGKSSEELEHHNDMEIAPETDNQTSDSADNLNDTELIELRLAALKSAMLKKHQDRKKKKAMQNQNEPSLPNQQDLIEINKENTQDLINKNSDLKLDQVSKVSVTTINQNSVSIMDVKSTENTSYVIAQDMVNEVVNNVVACSSRNDSIIKSDENVNSLMPVENNSMDVANGCNEEDDDILRAMLLASISKKITAKSSVVSEKNCSNKTTVQKSSVLKPTSEIRKVSQTYSGKYASNNVKLIKPIVKTIKNEANFKINNVQVKPVNNISNTKPLGNRNILNSALIKSAVKPLIINVSAESDSDTECVTKGNVLKETVSRFLKTQRAEVEKQRTNEPPMTKKGDPDKTIDYIMEKSVMKLLPHSQQVEYRKLKQQLINARKRPRIKRLSQKLDSKIGTTLFKKVAKGKIEAAKTSSIEPATTRTPKVTQQEKKNILSFKKTLDDLQVEKDGRLQMKGKYKSLGPLLHQVHQASMDRSASEMEIKRLLQELQKARTKLAVSHQNFTTLVEQLVTKKDDIDKSSTSNICMNNKPKITSRPLTSTPNKSVMLDEICNVSSLNVSCIENKQILEMAPKNITKSKTSGNENKEILNACQQENVLLDPNDVTKVFVELPPTENCLPKYTSPLDNCSRETMALNPLIELCPYDLLGTCKDNECPYKHFL